MYRLSLLLVAAVTLRAQAVLTISPDPAFQCNANGLATVTLTWSGASGPVEVRVGEASGASMTGLARSQGSAATGDWVRDGQRFFLVNQAGVAEASAAARVRCGENAGSAAAAGSYFPLQVGNTWVYRVDSRAGTADYLIRTITGTAELSGQAYYVLNSIPSSPPEYLRSDADGRVWRYAGDRETLFFDPSSLTRTTYSGPLGNFADAVMQRAGDALLREDRIYARGVGLTQSVSTLLTGSSGGFTMGLYLIEARLEGFQRSVSPQARLSVAAENPRLDVTGRQVTNCAIPSYCVGCGFAGADPPGTYRPCTQARVESREAAPHTIELELLNPAGQSVYRAPAFAGTPGADSVRYVQLHLYSSQPGNNTPLAPGLYTLITRLKSASAESKATSTLSLEIF